MTEKDEKAIGVDGVMRSAKRERELDEIAARIFTQADGRVLLEWLRSITINVTHGPAVSNDELRHFEGQRYLVGLIERRRDNGGREPEQGSAGRRRRR